ncbi:MAG: transporter [Chitinophagaceae bacterium]
MKKKWTILLVLTFIVSVRVSACDICGCGAGSYYIGMLPEFNKKIMGLRYRYNALQTHLGAGGQTSYLTTREHYRTAELWGGWNLGTKLRLMGYLPVSFNEKRNQSGLSSKTGLGDAGAQAFYKLLDQKKAAGTKLLVHTLWMGAGVKLPTGKYEKPVKTTGQQDANIFQLGTGSIDFTANAMYDIRIQDIGLNAQLSYKMNNVNREEYRYGNRLSANLQAYHKFRIAGKWTLVPNMGALYETSQQDHDSGFRVPVSGGSLLAGTVGFEAVFNSITIGGNFQEPLRQEMAGGFVKAGSRAMLHCAILF